MNENITYIDSTNDSVNENIVNIVVSVTVFLCFIAYVFVFCYSIARYGAVDSDIINKIQKKGKIHCYLSSEQLPIITVENKEQYSDINFSETCSICLEEFQDNPIIRLLPCNHYFHVECIDPWLISHGTCPLCKSNIVELLETKNSITDITIIRLTLI